MKKIIIVGAGLSGLVTAYELSKHGSFEIIILEKEAYVGGRIKTLEVEGRRVDVGALMVFSWYKYFRHMVKELGLSSKLIRSRTNGQAFDRGDHVEYYKKTPLRKFISFSAIWAVLMAKVRRQINFYYPQKSTLIGSLQDIDRKNSNVINNIQYIAEGYTYDTLDQLDKSIYLPFAYNVLLKGGFDNVDSFSGGTDTLVNALRAKIEGKGVRIKTGVEVISVKNHEVTYQGGSIIADQIVLASGGKLVANYMQSIGKSLNMRMVSGVVLTITCNPLKKRWFVLYTQHKLTSGSKIVSIGNQTAVGERSDSKKEILHVYIKTPSSKKVDIHQLKKEVIGYLSEPRLGIQNAVVAIESVWGMTMPTMTRQDLMLIDESQGQNGVFISGDLLGPPSMETAVYSGIRTAKEILKKY